jgi:hypothetical protein
MPSVGHPTDTPVGSFVTLESFATPKEQAGSPSVFELSDQQLDHQAVRVSRSSAVVGGTWSGCRFVVVGDAELAFRASSFENCVFETESSDRAASLSFNACNISQVTTRGNWLKIQLVNQAGPIKKSNLDCRVATFYAPGVTFDKCIITAVAERWQTKRAMFRDSFVSPEITLEGDLSYSQFHGSTVVVGDWTNVCANKDEVNLQTAAHIRDDWAELKTDYTGIRLYIIFFLTLAFLLPYLGKAWVLSVAAGALRGRGISVEWVPLWRAVIFPAGQTFLESVVAIMLITYNAGRAWLTLYVARMRERETHLLSTGFTAARPSLGRRRLKIRVLSRPVALSPVLAVHRILGVLFYISLISAVIRMLQFLLQRVPVF